MKKKIKKRRLNIFNLVVLVTMILCGALLIHDFVYWGVIQMFAGVTYQVTYFGLFIDFVAIGLMEASIQIVKEW